MFDKAKEIDEKASRMMLGLYTKTSLQMLNDVIRFLFGCRI